MQMKSHLGALIALVLLGACSGGGEEAAAGARGPNGEPVTKVDTGCSRFFFKGQPPVIVNPQMAGGNTSLCFRAFAVEHSPKSRTALWSAEVLTPTTVVMASRLERDDEFHPEGRLKPAERAELKDYRRSGYDRGHLAPSADMPTPESQAESFSLANMIPQIPELNRGDWADLEKTLRRQARQGTMYVVTGPGFRGKAFFVGGRVMVPSHVWKAVLFPKTGAGVYVASNSLRPQWHTMSLAEFTAAFGIDPFPAAREETKKTNILKKGAAGTGPNAAATNGSSAGTDSAPKKYTRTWGEGDLGPDDNRGSNGSRYGSGYDASGRHVRTWGEGDLGPDDNRGRYGYSYGNGNGRGYRVSPPPRPLTPRERTGPVRDFPQD